MCRRTIDGERLPYLTVHVDIDTLSDEVIHDLQIAVGTGDHQRSLAVLQRDRTDGHTTERECEERDAKNG